MNRPIFLLSDFGTRDSYVGQVKAAIAAIAPGAPIIDLTHEIEPFAVDEAAWTLEVLMPGLPADAVVCAVVDPGVGGSRRANLAVAGGRAFVGPDNGLLSGLLADDERPDRGEKPVAVPAPRGVAVHDLCSPQFRLPSVSATFHGRDIFAPAAAHLSTGVDHRLFGPPVGTMVALPAFRGQPGDFGELHGYVVHVDRFGNLITTIRAAELFPCFELSVGEATIDRHVRTFSNVPEGRLLCHADSSGYVAIAVHKGSAAAATGAGRGDRVTVRCQ